MHTTRNARTLLESGLLRAPVVTTTLLVAIPAASWSWIALMAQDMYGAMSGSSAWMMTIEWDAAHTVLLFAMWAVMMTAMMLPSAAPLVLLYASALRNQHTQNVGMQLYALASGYLVVWTAFSVAAMALQRLLASMLMLTPMMEPATPAVAALILGAAAIYQLTPLKAACLRVCRSPFAYLVRHWTTGTAGAFRLGLRHGAYCLGCCWALMLLLFAGGVMNLWVIVALTLWVLVEKFAPFGEQSARVSGIALLAAAAYMLIT